MDVEVECPECGTVIRDTMADLDDAVEIELPLEPPRNRIVEAVDDDRVRNSYAYDEECGEWQDRYSFHLLWFEIVADALNSGRTLRHVPGNSVE